MRKIVSVVLLMVTSMCIVFAKGITGTYYGMYDDGTIGGEAKVVITAKDIIVSIKNDQYTGKSVQEKKEYTAVETRKCTVVSTKKNKWLVLEWPEGLFFGETNSAYFFLARSKSILTSVRNDGWKIKSQSMLASHDETYPPENMEYMDLKPWKSGFGNGINDRISIEVGTLVKPLLVLNGFISVEHPLSYYENARLKKVKIISKKTGKSKIVTFKDEPSFTSIGVSDIAAENTADEELYFDVLEVYEGEKNKQLCVTCIIPDFSK